jgi:hypothetical protein
MSIKDEAGRLAGAATLLALVAEAFPDARLERLWDGGPSVPIVSDEASRARADRVYVGMRNGDAKLFPYFLIGDDEQHEGGIAVYWAPRSAPGAYVSLVLEQLRRAAPDAYRRLVEEAKTG